MCFFFSLCCCSFTTLLLCLCYFPIMHLSLWYYAFVTLFLCIYYFYFHHFLIKKFVTMLLCLFHFLIVLWLVCYCLFIALFLCFCYFITVPLQLCYCTSVYYAHTLKLEFKQEFMSEQDTAHLLLVLTSEARYSNTVTYLRLVVRRHLGCLMCVNATFIFFLSFLCRT